MLIRERGAPSPSRTLLLKSSPIISDILANASASEETEISVFNSPPPWFRTDGIVNVIFGIASLLPPKFLQYLPSLFEAFVKRSLLIQLPLVRFQ